MYDSLSSHQQIKVIFKHEVRSVSILMGYQEPRFLPLLGLVRKVSVSLILIFLPGPMWFPDLHLLE